TAPDRDPVCFCAQQDLAQELGISDRALRGHEKALADLGLVEIDTAANGRRSGRALSNGRRLGINLRPLIVLLPQLIALDARHREEARRCQVLRLECSAAKRDVKLLIERLLTLRPSNPALPLLLQRRSMWPRRYAVLVGSDCLAAHLAEIQLLRSECEELLRYLPKPSGRVEPQLPAIQKTTPESSESCKGAETTRITDQERDCQIASTEVDKAAEPNPTACGAGAEDRSHNLRWLTPQVLRDLASPDLRAHLDLFCPDGLPCPRSLRTAVFHLLPHLHIGEEVMHEAAAVFGDLAACLTVLVIDANRDHPTHPIRCPGAALRRFTQLQARATFNLAGALASLRHRRRCIS
ncbi:helix-turn-helix domain-containing protein, partial [Paracoccus laeviglucosivorans]